MLSCDHLSSSINYSSMLRDSWISAIVTIMVSFLTSSITYDSSGTWASWMGSAWILFFLKQGKNSRMKIIMEDMRPKPRRMNDGRTWCIVRGLFPCAFLFVQKDSSKWPRKAGEVVMSFSIFWYIPVSSKEEIALLKIFWNSMTVGHLHNLIPLFYLHLEGLILESWMQSLEHTTYLC